MSLADRTGEYNGEGHRVVTKDKRPHCSFIQMVMEKQKGLYSDSYVAIRILKYFDKYFSLQLYETVWKSCA